MHSLTLRPHSKSIRVMVANQFPLKSTEFVRGSPQCNEYVSVMDKVSWNRDCRIGIKIISIPVPEWACGVWECGVTGGTH